jgi:hypothetical protein
LLTFFFKDTYNTRLKERYRDDPFTHLDLNLNMWLEARSSGGPDRNRVYNFSNTIAEDLQTTRGVSTIGFSQSISSTQTPEFEVILDQRVQARTTHLDANYKRLSAETTELR